MWIPSSEEEIVEAVARGDLEETHTLEFKREVGSNTKEIAKDICAMTVDGGVIIYGIGEDEQSRATLSPLILKGEPERIDQVVASGIHEPPVININVIDTVAEPDKGFLVVEIPASPRAPHMVQLRNENRYYGRGNKTVRKLDQGEVERLYERRLKWEHRGVGFLEETLSVSPLKPREDFGYLYVTAEALFADEGLLEDILRSIGGSNHEPVYELVKGATSSLNLPSAGHKRFYVSDCRRSARGWMLYLATSAAAERDREPSKVFDVELYHNGSARLFFGSAASTLPSMGDTLIIFERRIESVVLHFLHLLRVLYRGRYSGPVDVGVALTGLEGAYSWAEHEAHFYTSTYPDDEYRRTIRTLALELEKDICEVAGKLVNTFFEVSAQGSYKPFGTLDSQSGHG